MKKIIYLISMMFMLISTLTYSQIETKTVYNLSGTIIFGLEPNDQTTPYYVESPSTHSLTFKNSSSWVDPNSWTNYGNGTYINKTFHITDYIIYGGSPGNMSISYSDTVITFIVPYNSSFTYMTIWINGYFIRLTDQAHVTAQIRFRVFKQTYTSINEINKIQTFIYPNPFTNNINIDLNNANQSNVKISIVNYLSQIIYYNETSDNKINIPLNCSKGIYFVLINNVAYKIVKE
jgi:hypothetical protein